MTSRQRRIALLTGASFTAIGRAGAPCNTAPTIEDEIRARAANRADGFRGAEIQWLAYDELAGTWP